MVAISLRPQLLEFLKERNAGQGKEEKEMSSARVESKGQEFHYDSQYREFGGY